MISGKNTWKHMIAALAVVLIAGVAALVLPKPAFAADTDIGRGISGSLSWTVSKSGKLTVTGSGEFGRTEYEGNGEVKVPEWCNYADKITSANISVTGVTDASYFFYGCYNLKSVDLSAFDTGSVTNMSYMFYGCESLKKLDVSGFDTSRVTDMSSMFRWCSGLTSLDVSSFQAENVTDMSAMFYDCLSLTTLKVSGSTGSVTDMSYMFYGCESLTKLDVSGLDTGNVTNMGSMFGGCSGLKTLDVSNFKTGSVTDMSCMFGDCVSLKKLDVSKFNTAGVIYMGGMFAGCSSLTSLDLSCFNAGSAVDMWYMFRDCAKLSEIYSPKNVGCDYAYIQTTEDYAWTLPSGAVITELPKNYKSTARLTRKPQYTKDNTTVTLSGTSFTYSGSAKKPTVTVKNSEGKTIGSGYYTVTYKNNTKVGKATLTIKFKKGCVGTIKKTFKINPKGTSLQKVTSKNQTVTVTWKKQTTQTTGYEIEYSTNSKFKDKTTVTVGKTETSFTKKLKANKTYYFRIRTYRTSGGKNYYSAWSKTMSVKT